MLRRLALLVQVLPVSLHVDLPLHVEMLLVQAVARDEFHFRFAAAWNLDLVASVSTVVLALDQPVVVSCLCLKPLPTL